MDNGPWRLVTSFDILQHAWDGETAVFHSGSGDTHLVNQAAAAVLAALQEGAVTLMELNQKIVAAGSQSPADLNSPHHIERALIELERLGLVERIVK